MGALFSGNVFFIAWDGGQRSALRGTGTIAIDFVSFSRSNERFSIDDRSDARKGAISSLCFYMRLLLLGKITAVNMRFRLRDVIFLLYDQKEEEGERCLPLLLVFVRLCYCMMFKQTLCSIAAA